MFGQLSNTKEYLKRVKDAGGTVRNDVQLALNNFTKKIYKEGLRSTNGLNHTIKHCNVYPTESKNGSKFNLWFVGNGLNHDDVGYNYSVDSGCEIFDEINTNFSTLNTSLNDGHMGWYITTPYDDVALIGANNGRTDRMMCHPNGYGGFYLDFGNDVTNSGRTLFSIPDANISSTLGLGIATKSGSQARHILNGTIVKTSTLNTNLNVSAGNFIFKAYNEGFTRTNLIISGFTFGSDIPNSKLASYKSAWDTLQAVISEKRDPNYVNIPTPKLWFDATDASTLRTNSGSQVSSNGFVRTWNDKSGNGKNIETQSSSITAQYINGGLRLLSGTNAANFSRNDGLYFGTIAFVIQFDNSMNANSGSRNILQHTDGGFNYFSIGSLTSWVNGELVTVSGTGRVSIVDNRTIAADTKVVLIISMDGGFSGLGKINNDSFNTTGANQGSAMSPLSNVSFVINPTNGNFTGIVYEMRSYSETFTQEQIDFLATELTSKHGI